VFIHTISGFRLLSPRKIQCLLKESAIANPLSSLMLPFEVLAQSVDVLPATG